MMWRMRFLATKRPGWWGRIGRQRPIPAIVPCRSGGRETNRRRAGPCWSNRHRCRWGSCIWRLKWRSACRARLWPECRPSIGRCAGCGWPARSAPVAGSFRSARFQNNKIEERPWHTAGNGQIRHGWSWNIYLERKVFSNGAPVNGAGEQHGQLLGVIGYAEIRFYIANVRSRWRGKWPAEKTTTTAHKIKKERSSVCITLVSTQNQQQS